MRNSLKLINAIFLALMGCGGCIAPSFHYHTHSHTHEAGRETDKQTTITGDSRVDEVKEILDAGN